MVTALKSKTKRRLPLSISKVKIHSICAFKHYKHSFVHRDQKHRPSIPTNTTMAHMERDFQRMQVKYGAVVKELISCLSNAVGRSSQPASGPDSGVVAEKCIKPSEFLSWKKKSKRFKWLKKVKFLLPMKRKTEEKNHASKKRIKKLKVAKEGTAKPPK